MDATKAEIFFLGSIDAGKIPCLSVQADDDDDEDISEDEEDDDEDEDDLEGDSLSTKSSRIISR